MLNNLILCPSARLARSIQHDIARTQIQSGLSHWQSPPVKTLSQWLDQIIEESLLTGEPPQAQTLLNPFNEQLLWQEVISKSLQKNVFGDLFDVAGLASTAVEANKYVIAWNLHVPREYQAEESKQFIAWQRAFHARCRELNVLETVRYFDWQLDCLAKNAGALPAQIAFAGFDQAAPQELRLRKILTERGVQVSEYNTVNMAPAQSQHISLENQEAECRAAIAWAKQQLDENPNIRLAIVTPQLNALRNQLSDLLDDVFYPASVRPSLANSARCYNFSLGTPLAQQPLIQAALNLLRLLTGYNLQQTDITSMLLSPFWSASQQEADARAQLDAKMREYLPVQFTLVQFLKFAKIQHENGLHIEHLLSNIQATKALIKTKKNPASQWILTLTAMLDALRWPGERSLTSLEYQTTTAWQKALQQLGKLDVLGKDLSFSEAVHLIQQICNEQVFQAEAEGESSIQILGMMEALSSPVDAMWVIGMNDHIWPPPARPNPLLPAFIQRAAAVPNADNKVQAAFAATVQQRLLHSAMEIIFSSSKIENNSQLRASPFLKDIPTQIQVDIPQAETLAETLSKLGNHDLTHIDDQLVPAVQIGEHVSGGTGLFRAQAVCPAWAFYQYRLGAKALKTPTNGLDAMTRGILVHDVLAAFWQEHNKFNDKPSHKPNDKLSDKFRHFSDLRDMSENDLEQALNLVIEQVLTTFSAEQTMFSQNILELEQGRLQKLIGDWLAFEKERGIPFKIIACEAEKKIMVAGIEVTLKIDRIHALENGGVEFVDYKTGQIPNLNDWGEGRLTEPQLPIYAIFYDNALNVSGVQFGIVKTADHGFSGICETDFATEIGKRKPKFIQHFTNWQDLLTHWKTSIEAIAEEIKSGVAPIKFADEKDLMYCEVTPLLRLPERQLQFERAREANESTS